MVHDGNGLTGEAAGKYTTFVMRSDYGESIAWQILARLRIMTIDAEALALMVELHIDAPVSGAQEVEEAAMFWFLEPHCINYADCHVFDST